MSKQKSELQLAADRVREMQVAIENMEKNLQVCQDEYQVCKKNLDEAARNLADTEDLLMAQRNKLEREIESVRNIVGTAAVINNYHVSWGGGVEKHAD